MPDCFTRAACALALIAPLISCVTERAPDSEPPRQSRQTVVYGEDSRFDVYDHPDEALRELARRSIVAMVPRDDLDQSDPEDIRIISGESLGEAFDLCEDQRFRDHPRLSSCSATLIDDDLVLTAGHCMGSQNRCNNRFFVFDAHFAAEGQLETISSEDVYTCQRLLQTVPGGDLDHAIIQLDRPVTGDHGPAPVKIIDEPLERGSEAILIGFPSQIPTKIAAGGRVISPRGSTLDFFEATVDAFGGNSGSGVFNAEGEVIGILVRGEQDYRDRGECTVVNVLDEERTSEQGAEDITYVARAIERLCAQGFESERLCGHSERGACYTCEADEDCLDGWTCRQWDDATEVSFCSAPCQSDDECRNDHTCDVELGRCQPRRERRCQDGDVFEFDVCGGGRVLRPEVECVEGQFCRSGGCVTQEEGNTCNTAEIIEPVTQTIEGVLSGGFSNNRRSSCGGNGPDRMLTFTLEEATTVRAIMSGFDTVLHLRSNCRDGDTEIICNDDNEPPGDRGSLIEADLEPGTYTIIVDAFTGNVGDGFTLDLRFGPVCDDICEIGTFVCADNAPRECVADEVGCPSLGDAVACEGDQICVGGRCVVQGEGDHCDAPTEIEAVSQTIEGDLREGYQDNHQGSCNGDGPEQVFAFTVETQTRFQALVAGFDSVMYLRTDCERDSEVVCNDDLNNPQDLGSGFTVLLEPGRYFLFVDAFGGRVDTYTLALLFASDCENECLDGETQCDQNGLQTCVAGSDGCTVWGEPEPCGASEVCREGECQEDCQDECNNPGGRTCVGEDTYRLCGVAPGGCTVLGPPRECANGGVCVGDGNCEIPEPEPEPEPDDDKEEPPATTTPKDDGCGCAVAAPSPPLSPWWLMLALALGFRRARAGGRKPR